MNLDAIISLLGNFDLAALIPDLDTVLGRLELFVRMIVMIGPLVLLGLGLWYFFVTPKKENVSTGFRVLWGTRSKDVWYFAQKIAGMTWTVLGFLLTVIMLLICGGYRGMEAMDMVDSAYKCILWEVGLVLASFIGIHVAVGVCFDWNGNRRPPKKTTTKRERPAR